MIEFLSNEANNIVRDVYTLGKFKHMGEAFFPPLRQCVPAPSCAVRFGLTNLYRGGIIKQWTHSRSEGLRKFCLTPIFNTRDITTNSAQRGGIAGREHH